MNSSALRYTRLLPHNLETFQKTISLLENNQRVCFVQATGTGKSWIITALIEVLLQEECQILLLSSKSEIIKQFQTQYLEPLSRSFLEHNEMVLYQRLESHVHLDLYGSLCYHPDRYHDLTCIFADEFHRAGSPQHWKSLNDLITRNPMARLIGATATDIRNDGNDMRDALFANCCSNRTDLIDAIVDQKILPKPRYICCFYNESELLNEWLETYRSLPVRRQSQSLIRKATKAISSASGLPQVLQHALVNDKGKDPEGKYIVFCKNISQLHQMMEEAKKEWFRWMKKSPLIYYQHFHEKPGGQDYDAFKKSRKKGLHLLFSVNMFTEGVHIPDLSGILIMRPIYSNTLQQQIFGRPLTIRSGDGDSRAPLILDIADSLDVLSRRKSFLTFSRTINNEPIPAEPDSDQQGGNYKFLASTPSIGNVLSQLKKVCRLRIPWGEAYEIASTYYLKHKNLNVPKNTWINGLDLYRWLATQRYLGRSGRLSPDRKERLDRLHFDWNKDPEWDQYFEQVSKLPRKNGHPCITKKTCPVGSPLPAWAEWQRKRYFHKVGPALTEEQLKKLRSINFDFSPRSPASLWDNHFRAVLAFYEEHHHLCIPSTGDTAPAYRQLKNLWACFQEYPNSDLESRQYEELKRLGFLEDVTFGFLIKYQMYKELLLNLTPEPDTYTETQKQVKSFRRWLGRQKMYRRQGRLNKAESALLEELIELYCRAEQKFPMF